MDPQPSPNNVSRLRNHLEPARAAYRNERYPGDLADELLARPRRRIIPWTIVTTAVTGIAAALLFWVGARPDRPIWRGRRLRGSPAPDAARVDQADRLDGRRGARSLWLDNGRRHRCQGLDRRGRGRRQGLDDGRGQRCR